MLTFQKRGEKQPNDRRNNHSKRDEQRNGDHKDNKPEHAEVAVEPEVVKHPLNHAWTLWYYEPDHKKSWNQNQYQVNTFDTVEDFWSLFSVRRLTKSNSLSMTNSVSAHPSTRRTAQRIRLLNVQAWNPADVGGQRQQVRRTMDPLDAETTDRETQQLLDRDREKRFSLKLASFPENFYSQLLCLIGEEHRCSADICGTVVNMRPKGVKLAVWTSDSKDEETVMAIGHMLKQCLRLDQRTKLQYETHLQSMSKNSSAVKALYEI